MSTALILLWILGGVLAFGLALALQMRVMIGVVLARALRAMFDELTIRESRLAVIVAGNQIDPEGADEALRPAVAHLYATHQKPLHHLAIARRASTFIPPILLVLIAIGRFGLTGS